ncbi:FxDxF family PEP-CTERM protein [Rhodoferax sp.]|uniref:FxDxF family PEP-CTERM protein n=1 Tax=Rhodoferax sp. TaxID=50421 RepID=UPI0025EB606E|nr:FxDxF family PEP-CTERM protein [Rhodoferax sp.]
MILNILKKTAAAVMLMASAVAAQAATFSVGPLSTSYANTVDFAGSFEDTYTFTLPGSFSGVAGSYIGFDFAGTGLATSFSFGSGASSTPTVSLPLNGTLSGVDVASYSTTLPLTPGASYWFKLSGTGDLGSYTVTLAPVPEPETYALLLAGLGLMGVIARRRQSK